MFKYIKTIHSHTTAEISRHTVQNHMDIPTGTLCQISNGYLIHVESATKPYYLVVEKKLSEDGKRALDCIRLLPGMVLTVTFDPEESSFSAGVLCSFTTDSNEHCTTITTGGTTAEVVDVDGNIATIIIN